MQNFSLSNKILYSSGDFIFLNDLIDFNINLISFFNEINDEFISSKLSLVLLSKIGKYLAYCYI
jgi:hypothetical protein